MSDRLKFRLYDKDIGHYFEKPYIFINTDGKLVSDDCVNVYEIDQKAYIVEQCTGLKDKNGKLIYEGDIVKCDEGIGKVFYSIPTASLGIEFSDYSIYGSNICHYDIDVIDCVIIGNIHENGDLLK